MFGRRINLFKLHGFEVRVDLSWVIIAVLVVWSLSIGLFPYMYSNLSPQTYWFMGVIGAIGLFLSIIIHEYSHSVIAKKYGMPMKGITLFIFGGVAEMGSEPPSAKAEFLMAVAGPISSIIISAVFFGIYRLGLRIGLPDPVAGVIGYIAMINGLLAAFNLLPAFPLDGGRMLRSILWGIKKNLRWATRISSAIGSGFGILLIVLGFIQVIRGNFIGGMWWFLIGMFLRGAAKSSYQQLLTRKALEGEQVSRFMKTEPISVPPSISVEQFVENYLYKFHYKLYPVMDSQKLMGFVTARQVKEIPKEDWNRIRLGEIVTPCSPQNTIEPQADAITALSKMNQTGTTLLLVTQGTHLAGVVSLKDMLSFLSLKVELED